MILSALLCVILPQRWRALLWAVRWPRLSAVWCNTSAAGLLVGNNFASTMAKRRLSHLDVSRSIWDDCFRSVPFGAFAAFILAAVGITLCNIAAAPIANALQGTSQSSDVGDVLEDVTVLLYFISMVDVLVLVTSCLSSGRQRECIFRGRGVCRWVVSWLLIPLSHLCLWMVFASALIFSYGALCALMAVRSIEYVCNSGDVARRAAQALEDAVVKARNLDASSAGNFTVEGVCKEIQELGNLPTELFVGSVILLLSQKLLLAVLEVYTRWNHVEASVFDSKYPDDQRSQSCKFADAEHNSGEVELAPWTA